MRLYIYQALDSNEQRLIIWENVGILKGTNKIVRKKDYYKDKIKYEYKEKDDLNKICLIKSSSSWIYTVEYISLEPVKDSKSLFEELKDPLIQQGERYKNASLKYAKTKKETKEMLKKYMQKHC